MASDEINAKALTELGKLVTFGKIAAAILLMLSFYGSPDSEKIENDENPRPYHTIFIDPNGKPVQSAIICIPFLDMNALYNPYSGDLVLSNWPGTDAGSIAPGNTGTIICTDDVLNEAEIKAIDSMKPILNAEEYKNLTEIMNEALQAYDSAPYAIPYN